MRTSVRVSSLDTLASLTISVPATSKALEAAVAAGAHQKRVIGFEAKGVDPIAMPGAGRQRPTRLQVPEPDGAIGTAAGQEAVGRIDGQAANLVFVAAESGAVVESLSEVIRLQEIEWKKIGGDLLMTALVANGRKK